MIGMDYSTTVQTINLKIPVVMFHLHGFPEAYTGAPTSEGKENTITLDFDPFEAVELTVIGSLDLYKRRKQHNGCFPADTDILSINGKSYCGMESEQKTLYRKDVTDKDQDEKLTISFKKLQRHPEKRRSTHYSGFLLKLAGLSFNLSSSGVHLINGD